MSTPYSFAAMVRYLRRPYFPAGRDPIGEDALRHLTQLLAACFVAMLVLSSIISGILSSAMGELPENVNAAVGEASPARLLLYGVILAPLFEEVIFRSWLGGRRACLIGFPILMSCVVIMMAVGAEVSPTLILAIAGGLSFLCFVVAKRAFELPAPEQKIARWRLFPVAFYGSVGVFALLHLSNYAGGLSAPIMLIAIIPQALVGAVLGYVRMRFGLIAAIAFHAVYNLLLIGIFLVSQSLAPIPTEATLIWA